MKKKSILILFYTIFQIRSITLKNCQENPGIVINLLEKLKKKFQNL